MMIRGRVQLVIHVRIMALVNMKGLITYVIVLRDLLVMIVRMIQGPAHWVILAKTMVHANMMELDMFVNVLRDLPV